MANLDELEQQLNKNAEEVEQEVSKLKAKLSEKDVKEIIYNMDKQYIKELFDTEIELVCEKFKINEYVDLIKYKDRYEIEIWKEPGRTNPEKVSIVVERNPEYIDQLSNSIKDVGLALLRISKKIGTEVES